MQLSERRDEWMGLGILLSEIRFRQWIENREDSKLGMRVQTRIEWKSLFTSGTDIQRMCVHSFLTQFGLGLEETYYDNDTILKFIELVNRLENEYKIKSGMTDKIGFHMVEWLLENPLPKEWDELQTWGQCYDDELDSIQISVVWKEE